MIVGSVMQELRKYNFLTLDSYCIVYPPNLRHQIPIIRAAMFPVTV